MLFRLFLFISGLLSFLYFLYPSSFEGLSPRKKDVLGIQQINAGLNKSTIETTLLAYCLNEMNLPENLNELYNGYLREERKLDLDSLFNYEAIDEQNCTYQLEIINGQLKF